MLPFGTVCRLSKFATHGVWQPLGFSQNDFRGNASNRRRDRRNRDRVQNVNGGIARKDQHFGRLLSGVLNAYQQTSPRFTPCPPILLIDPDIEFAGVTGRRA